MFAGNLINVGVAPGVVRNALLEIWPLPFGFIGGPGEEGGKAGFLVRVVAGVDAILVKRLFQSIDLGRAALTSDLPT